MSERLDRARARRAEFDAHPELRALEDAKLERARRLRAPRSPAATTLATALHAARFAGLDTAGLDPAAIEELRTAGRLAALGPGRVIDQDALDEAYDAIEDVGRAPTALARALAIDEAQAALLLEAVG
jgi:hypothetical protein